MHRFFHAEPVKKPEDIISYLGKQELHWKKGRSAYELAYSWISAQGIPATVERVLDLSPTYTGAVLLEGFFEHRTPLQTAGADSQTDLLCVVKVGSGLGVIGVEGKVDEPFGPFVKDWFDSRDGKRARLQRLLELLQVTESAAQNLRYQLFHRTAAAIFEAQRYGADHAMMLVHSFSPEHACFDDFKAFSKVLGAPVGAPSGISPTVMLGGVEVTLGWVADRPLP